VAATADMEGSGRMRWAILASLEDEWRRFWRRKKRRGGRSISSFGDEGIGRRRNEASLKEH
jgi:hypothetical protein